MNVFLPAVFLGAFLLFQIQPLIAKFILPWFGGGPGVWTTCMLFFQVMLLAGYAYAHVTTRFFSQRTQAAIHVGLLLLALGFLPVVPGAQWKPDADANPTQGILLLLMVCLGVPYFVLAATGPLLQAWFSRVHPGAVPYRLYALSNAGSLLALVSFPFLFEPNLTRSAQGKLWAWSFGAFVVLCAACAWRLWRTQPDEKPVHPKRAPAKPASAPTVEPAPTVGIKAWWFGLAACGSLMLLAVTNKLCQDVASVPFLWVLPLSLYLLTFIICFDRPAWYVRKWMVLLFIPPLALVGYTMLQGTEALFWQQLTGYSGCLFIGCMICHGELCRLKPAPRSLTSFYLFIATGGAAGGVFVGIIAPLVFQSYAELNWALWLLAALASGILIREQTRLRWRNHRWPLWPTLLLGVLILGGGLLLQAHRESKHSLLMRRNFYGVLRVVELSPGTPLHAYRLIHGNITHGIQLTAPPLSTLATTYYHESSGVGLALDNFPRNINRNVGVVGLGAGTLATYGRPGDTFRFYEIDPEVQSLAETRFTYLKDSKAHVTIVTGDARLSLEREPPQQFDVLVLDAFGSDAIPVHLLTEEAFATYFRHLKPDGAIAAHISNNHANLLPVLVGAAKKLRTTMVCIEWNEKQKPPWLTGSLWVILSHNDPFILSQPVVSHAMVIPNYYGEHPIFWTDDYASLLPLIRR